ncbi:putative Zinc finger, CCHC-type, aspartic peptidase domain superfamily [Plasmopara halstedii]
MDGLRMGPARTQLFRVQASTLEEAIQVALQEEYSHRQARTPATTWPGNSAPINRANSGGPVPMELGSAEQRDIRCYGCGKLGHMKRDCSAGGRRGRYPPSPGELRQPVGVGRPTGEEPSLHERCAGGAHHGDLAPESLYTLESAKSSGGLLVVHGRVRGYDHPFRILIDSGASRNFARRQTVAGNSNKLADALRESKGNGTVSVRLADGKFEDFDSSEQFTVLEMDSYDLILGMPWLEKHEPWIDWRGKAIGASRPSVSDRALVSHVPTSVRTWGARKGRQGTEVSKEYLRVVGVQDDSKGASMVAALGNAGQVGNLGPQAGNLVPRTAAAIESAGISASCVGNTVPHVVVQTLTEEEGGKHASCVSNTVPQEAASASDVVKETSHDVGNRVPRHGRRRRHRRRRQSSLNTVQTDVASSDSESRARTPSTARPGCPSRQMASTWSHCQRCQRY